MHWPKPEKHSTILPKYRITSINNTFINVNNQNLNTKVYSILNSTRSLNPRWHRVHTDKNKNTEHSNYIGTW